MSKIKTTLKEESIPFLLVTGIYIFVALLCIGVQTLWDLCTWSWETWAKTAKFTLKFNFCMWLIGLVMCILRLFWEGLGVFYQKVTFIRNIVLFVKKKLQSILNCASQIIESKIFGGIISITIYNWLIPLLHEKHFLTCPNGQKTVVYFYNPLFSETKDTETAYTCCTINETDISDKIKMVLEDKDGNPIRKNGEFVTEYVAIGADSKGNCCPSGTIGYRYMTKDTKIYSTCCPKGTKPDSNGHCCKKQEHDFYHSDEYFYSICRFSK